MRIENANLTAASDRRISAVSGTSIDPARSTSESQKLQKATEDFEGMLIGQMLQSVRESALGGWQEKTDQSGAIALEMAESQLARVMASNGGLGLAATLQKSLSKAEPNASKS